MAKDQTRRLKPSLLKEDNEVLAAISGMPDYAPADSTYAKTELLAKQTAMVTGQTTETQKNGEAAAARDAATAAEWDFHNYVLAAKNQVVAQYGEDSDQVQAIGLIKKSERKKPTHHTTTPPTP